MCHGDRKGEEQRVQNTVDSFIAITPCMLNTNKIGLDPLMLVDETLVDLVTLQQIIAGLLKWHMRSTLVKLQETISIPEVIF